MRKDKIVIILLVLVFFIVILLIPQAPLPEKSLIQTISHTYTVYLPIVSRPLSNYGVEIEGTTSPELKSYYLDGSLLKISVHWSYNNWDLSELQDELDWWPGGANLIVNVKGWDCHKPPNYQYDDYVDYTNAVIGWIKSNKNTNPMIEIWNEPGTYEDRWPTYFGCWGDNYSAGVQYSDFVDYVTNRLSDDIIILAGAFAVYNSFSDGALLGLEQNPRVDYISFHCHNPADDCSDEIALWYGKTTKRLFLSEFSSVCFSLVCDSFYLPFETLQVSTWNNAVSDRRIHGAVWYTLGYNGWLNSDMIAGCEPWNGGVCRPRLAYCEYQNMFP